MKKLLISIVVASFFVVPVAAQAGNLAPKLFLELWSYTDLPDPIPTEVCVHMARPQVGPIHCYDTKAAFQTAIVALHVGQLTEPICPTVGPPCKTTYPTYGGWLGFGFGMSTTGEAVTYLSWTACPGFLKGPSGAGEPSALLASSFSGCHDWWDHLGYVMYLNASTRTGTTFVNITASGDSGIFDLINCYNEYDADTEIGYNAQWGGPNTLTCPSGATAVETTTWGRIKSLYR